MLLAYLTDQLCFVNDELHNAFRTEANKMQKAMSGTTCALLSAVAHL
jgi:hypothetical protein